MSDLPLPAATAESSVSTPPPSSKTIIGVRFMRVGKIYHFDATGFDVRPGDRVIVETTRGRQLGEVVRFIPPEAQSVPDGGYKRIEGVASPRELAMETYWKSKETEAMISCRARAAELLLTEVKIVKAEYSYDGSRLTFLYSGPDEQNGNPARVDLKSLKEDMQALYPQQLVQFRQIGPRDVAKLLGGLGACGLETRCCSLFLTEFSPISIKMAKEQGISLEPEEITGMCGRLRCCLVYEYEQYVAARKQLPKLKKIVLTPKGEGKVVDLNPLKETVWVEIREGEGMRSYEFHKNDIQPKEELEALQKKASNPCDRHNSGGCDCGKAKKR
ncbi:MAG: regulatory iron-sulfur-containing complex subunit RicT [Anaerolineales bacterium]|nr:regulatory iron-sulfur-containing complex subunit RicT [Anaerolineales bacterium]